MNSQSLADFGLATKNKLSETKWPQKLLSKILNPTPKDESQHISLTCILHIRLAAQNVVEMNNLHKLNFCMAGFDCSI